MGVTIRAFKALRPKPDLASKVAALPYDVMNTEEAREMATGNPYSFLHVDKAEIDLPPDTDPYSNQVYSKAAENLKSLAKTAMLRDEQPNLYIYRLTGYGQTQTGLAACVSAAEYELGLIKRHEFTRPDKEQDRINHMEACEAHTGPIFLAYRSDESAKPEEIISECIKQTPVYDFTAEDNVRHEMWVISDKTTQDALAAAFRDISYLYIADGHHRNATAVKVAHARNEKITSAGGDLDPNAEHDFYLAVIFPHSQLKILDYNRVVKDLNGMDKASFLGKLNEGWSIEKSPTPVKPSKKHEVGMYMSKQWYKLTAKNPPGADDAIGNLDCSVLQNSLLSPILGITDPRSDKRIDFVGGIRGLEELEKRVNSGEMAVAFALFPTSMEELMNVADKGQIMPPKSTWFEPKLRSGLLVHNF
ncbi:MAG: DUF1015 family protein [Defluviitaleaceae bacterium]|nr:DUF1015 family protein [Defluviitaleaceae bacterium]